MKTWCRHIKWEQGTPTDPFFWWIRWHGEDKIVPRQWQVCPICRKLRPGTKRIKRKPGKNETSKGLSTRTAKNPWRDL